MNRTKTLVITGLIVAVGSFSALRAAEMDARQHEQQERIAQGEKSGQLTKKEAGKLEKEHKAIHEEIKADRAANGGKLTKEEKKEINKKQNKESRRIYRKKHNATTKVK